MASLAPAQVRAITGAIFHLLGATPEEATAAHELIRRTPVPVTYDALLEQFRAALASVREGTPDA